MTGPETTWYRLLFGERTILGEGYLLLTGICVYACGHLFDQPLLTGLGLWMTWPFIVTVLVALVILAPWFWWRERVARSAKGREHGGREE